jgi:hypothetical protein
MIIDNYKDYKQIGEWATVKFNPETGEIGEQISSGKMFSETVKVKDENGVRLESMWITDESIDKTQDV